MEPPISGTVEDGWMDTTIFTIAKDAAALDGILMGHPSTWDDSFGSNTRQQHYKVGVELLIPTDTTL